MCGRSNDGAMACILFFVNKEKYQKKNFLAQNYVLR